MLILLFWLSQEKVAVCQRTVVNLSENHRKILGALYDLHGEFPNRGGFTHREIASGAEVSPQTVSNNKAFGTPHTYAAPTLTIALTL